MDTKKFRIIHDGAKPLTYGKLRELLDYHDDLDADAPVTVHATSYHCCENDVDEEVKHAIVVIDGQLHINHPTVSAEDLERMWRESPEYKTSPEYAAEQEALRVKREADAATRAEQRARDEETREARRAQLEAFILARGWGRSAS